MLLKSKFHEYKAHDRVFRNELYNNGTDSADESKMEIIFRIQLSCSILRFGWIKKYDEQIKMNGIQKTNYIKNGNRINSIVDSCGGWNEKKTFRKTTHTHIILSSLFLIR